MIFNLFSVVIQINDGLVKGVLWDNECIGCTYSTCDYYEIPDDDRIEGGPIFS